MDRTDPTAWITTDVASGIKRRSIRTEYSDGHTTIAAEFMERSKAFADEPDSPDVWTLRIPDELQRACRAVFVDVPVANNDPADMTRVDAAAAGLLAAVSRYRLRISAAMDDAVAAIQNVVDDADAGARP